MYNFDKLPNRLGTNSEKWNVLENELPMWVADMDFDNSPEIKDALRKRVELGAYGYSYPSDEWYESYIRFFKDIHNVEYDIMIYINTNRLRQIKCMKLKSLKRMI